MRRPKNVPTSVQVLDEAPRPEPILGSRVGWIAGVDMAHGVLVDYEGNPRGPLPARSTVPLDSKAIDAAATTKQGAVLLFDKGDPTAPLILGLLQPVSTTPLLDDLLCAPPGPTPSLPAGAPATGSAATTLSAGSPVEAKVDGKRVVLEGKDEIVLKCGQASITLWRNGKVVIKGVQLEAQATGVNRIKGGSVQIN